MAPTSNEQPNAPYLEAVVAYAFRGTARYHVPGSVLGWHVLETNDMSALAEHVNNWGDLIDIELNPIVEDAQAAEAAARVFGK